MKIEHSYSCNKTEAYSRVDGFLDQLQKQYSDMISNSQRTWNSQRDRMDFSFSLMTFNVKGSVQLNEHGLVLDGKVPLLARPFSGKIESAIKGKLEELF